MRIRFDTLGGELPKIASRIRPDGSAERAVDCRLGSGRLRSLRGLRSIGPAPVADARTLFATDGKFLAWAGDVDAIETPVAAAVPRVFFTGDGAPKQGELAELLVGRSFRLGVPAPLTAPTVVLQPVRPGESQDVVYVTTFVNRWTEEGSISPPLARTVRPGETVTVLGGRGDNVDLDDYAVTAWRLYRTVGNGIAQFVGEAPIDQDTIEDEIDAVLAGSLDSTEYFPPPVNLAGLHIMSNGIALGFIPGTRRVVVSEPFLPGAMPHEIITRSVMVGISSYGNTAVLLTDGHPEIATIVDPRVIVPVRLTDREPCVSKRGIVQGGPRASACCGDAWRSSTRCHRSSVVAT